MTLTELFRDESKWAQGNYAYARNGKVVDPCSRNAICWCLIGAMHKCYRGRIDEELAHIARKAIGTVHYATLWNDNPNRTFSQIKSAAKRIDAAMAKLIAKEIKGV